MSRLVHSLLPRLPRQRRRRLLWICFGILVFVVGIRSVILPWFLGPAKYVPSVFENYHCPVTMAQQSRSPLPRSIVAINGRPKTRCETRVLLLVDNQFSALGQQLRFLLNALKVPYKTQVIRRNLPSLANRTNGRYMIIIYENFYRYLNLNKWNRQLLDKYCREYGAALVGFLPNQQSNGRQSTGRSKVLGFPLYLHSNMRMQDLRVSADAQLTYLVRSGVSFKSELNDSDSWIGLVPDHSTYTPVLYGLGSTTADLVRNVSIILLDSGKLDGVRRLLIGKDFASFWPMRLLFLDAIRALSYEAISFPLTRYLQIDIDDVFVGHLGTKMTADDVRELERSQQRIRAHVSNFVYNLGFCGHFYGKGNELEKEGDNALIGSLSQQFRWFPHFWTHLRAHALSNFSDLVAEMHTNRNFAELHGIHVSSPYAVAPHHSGVYPVYDPLYLAWKQVWNVQVTSTEEYPHLKPATLRRGFVHKDIMVLPRQTCGLYTHTIYMDQFPGGKATLDASIYGGELFYTMVFNPFLIFMTHQANYARDRLAVYTFENVVRFIRCWTNINLETISPTAMATKYFAAYPDEVNPVWGNPCADQRHVAILSSPALCDSFPDAVIVGPQKTGTTALYKFLELHSAVRVSRSDPTTFEEVQFFCGKNYMNGINWYVTYFPKRQSSDVLIEKSATYFDSELAPKRIKALMPNAKIVVVLISPVMRAYSWYQHVKAHNSPTALTNDFMDVLRADEDADVDLWHFRQRCLTPGHYSHHLERWLSYFPAKQIYIVNGDLFKSDPATVMNGLQDFLELQPPLNYSTKLVFVESKGFNCYRDQKDQMHCLGSSKGRHYAPMQEETRHWLLNYYKPHNAALLQLLNRLGYETPSWLQKELREVS